MASMESGLRLPIALDPLIAEAKQRMRRRRLLWAALLVIGAAALSFSLWPSGGPARVRSAQSGHGDQRLASLAVPMGKYEREWREWIRKLSLESPASSSSVAHVQREVRRSVAASGARVVRLMVWPTTAPPAVELVIATAVRPATYLRHDLRPLLSSIGNEYRYVEVVDRDGTSIFKSGYRIRDGHPEGTVGVPPELQACSPASAWGNWALTPCPVK